MKIVNYCRIRMLNVIFFLIQDACYNYQYTLGWIVTISLISFSSNKKQSNFKIDHVKKKNINIYTHTIVILIFINYWDKLMIKGLSFGI